VFILLQSESVREICRGRDSSVADRYRYDWSRRHHMHVCVGGRRPNHQPTSFTPQHVVYEYMYLVSVLHTLDMKMNRRAAVGVILDAFLVQCQSNLTIYIVRVSRSWSP